MMEYQWIMVILGVAVLGWLASAVKGRSDKSTDQTEVKIAKPPNLKNYQRRYNNCKQILWTNQNGILDKSSIVKVRILPRHGYGHIYKYTRVHKIGKNIFSCPDNTCMICKKNEVIKDERLQPENRFFYNVIDKSSETFNGETDEAFNDKSDVKILLADQKLHNFIMSFKGDKTSFHAGSNLVVNRTADGEINFKTSHFEDPSPITDTQDQIEKIINGVYYLDSVVGKFNEFWGCPTVDKFNLILRELGLFTPRLEDQLKSNTFLLKPVPEGYRPLKLNEIVTKEDLFLDSHWLTDSKWVVIQNEFIMDSLILVSRNEVGRYATKRMTPCKVPDGYRLLKTGETIQSTDKTVVINSELGLRWKETELEGQRYRSVCIFDAIIRGIDETSIPEGYRHIELNEVVMEDDLYCLKGKWSKIRNDLFMKSNSPSVIRDANVVGKYLTKRDVKCIVPEGCRFLKDGEVTEEGDQFFSAAGEWQKKSKDKTYKAYKAYPSVYNLVIRKVTPSKSNKSVISWSTSSQLPYGYRYLKMGEIVVPGDLFLKQTGYHFKWSSYGQPNQHQFALEEEKHLNHYATKRDVECYLYKGFTLLKEGDQIEESNFICQKDGSWTSVGVENLSKYKTPAGTTGLIMRKLWISSMKALPNGFRYVLVGEVVKEHDLRLDESCWRYCTEEVICNAKKLYATKRNEICIVPNGYRLLKNSEKIKPDDKLWSMDGHWVAVHSVFHGEKYNAPIDILAIREI